jgi:hypothetical protein
MAKLNAIAVDLQKSNDGVWVDHELGYSFKIAEAGNENYMKYLRQIQKPVLARIRIKEEGLMEDLVKQAAAKFILVDWKNIEDESGQPIPYSPEKALELFKNPALHKIYDWILEKANDFELYKQQVQTDSIKN